MGWWLFENICNIKNISSVHNSIAQGRIKFFYFIIWKKTRICFEPIRKLVTIELFNLWNKLEIRIFRAKKFRLKISSISCKMIWWIEINLEFIFTQWFDFYWITYPVNHFRHKFIEKTSRFFLLVKFNLNISFSSISNCIQKIWFCICAFVRVINTGNGWNMILPIGKFSLSFGSLFSICRISISFCLFPSSFPFVKITRFTRIITRMIRFMWLFNLKGPISRCYKRSNLPSVCQDDWKALHY